MLTKNTQINRDQVEMIALDQLVPADHLVCKMEDTIDFSFIYSMVEDLYSTERGRSSIDPVKGSQLYPESTCMELCEKLGKFYKIDPEQFLIANGAG